jgi:hypothetical protein
VCVGKENVERRERKEEKDEEFPFLDIFFCLCRAEPHSVLFSVCFCSERLTSPIVILLWLLLKLDKCGALSEIRGKKRESLEADFQLC